MTLSPRTTATLVGICGGIETGKDKVAEHLADAYGFSQLSFALKLKKQCQDLFNLTDGQAGFGTHEEKLEPIPHLGLVPAEVAGMGGAWPERVGKPWCGRWILEWMGTDAARTVWGPVWVEALRKHIVADREAFATPAEQARIVVSDVRFQNEADMIKELGGILVRTIIQDVPYVSNGHESDTWHITADVDFDLVAPKPGLTILFREMDMIMARYHVPPIS